MGDIRSEISHAISELEKRGISSNSHRIEDLKGLGDVIEDVLKSMGITEERFKQWFGLKECNCSKRKAWLNNLFAWKKNQS